MFSPEDGHTVLDRAERPPSVLPRLCASERYIPPELLWRSGERDNRWAALKPRAVAQQPTRPDVQRHRAFFKTIPTVKRSPAVAFADDAVG